MGNGKNQERIDVQLEEWEKEEKMHDMERGSTHVDVGGMERERALRGQR